MFVTGVFVAVLTSGCVSVPTTDHAAPASLSVLTLTATPTDSATAPDATDSPSSAAPAPAQPTSQPVTTPAAPPLPAPPPPHIPKPTTAAPQPPSTCGAPANPFGYNFCGRGGYIYSPASNVCDYFQCIDNFSNGVGYMIECNDGTYSMSGGRHGACSYHSGVARPVYSG